MARGRRDCTNERELARKLICEQGMSLRTASATLGVSKGAISRWAKEDGWVLRKDRDAAFRSATQAFRAAPDAEGTLALPDGFKMKRIKTDDMKSLSENLIRACIHMLMSAGTEKGVSKVLEQAVKVWLSLEVGKQEAGEYFQVMVPAVAERYGRR